MNGPRRLAVLLAVGVGLLAFGSGSAFGATESVDVFTRSFGSATSTPPNPYPLGTPAGMAVDNSGGPSDGDIYVVDQESYRVEKFNPQGELLLMFGKQVNKTASETTGSTEEEQNVCVIGSGDECQAGVFAGTNGAFEEARAIAVDDSSGPSSGDVYVGNTGFENEYVLKYDESGYEVRSWAREGQLKSFYVKAMEVDPKNGDLYVEDIKMDRYDQAGEILSEFVMPGGPESYEFAIDSSGNFYQTSHGEPPNTGVLKYSPRGSIEAKVETLAESPGPIALDPVNDDIYVLQQESGGYFNHYDGYCGGLCTPIDQSAPGHFGTAIDVGATLGRVYVADFEDEVAVYEKRGAKATADTQTAAGETTATVTGSVDPAGQGPITSCHVEYGGITSLTLSESAPCDQQGFSSPAEVSAELEGLTPGTNYRFRIAVGNANGEVHGLWKTFQTTAAPTISSFRSFGVTAGGAALIARIKPNGAATTYRFEYGPTVTYGSSAPIPAGTIETELSNVDEVEARIGGLEPGAVYHFRVVAENASGTTVSADQTFSFHPSECPNQTVREQSGSVNLPDCRAYELVSAQNAGDSVLFPAMGPNTGRADSPSRLAYDTWGGVVPNSGEVINTAGDMYVATRTSEGWHSKYIGLTGSEAYLVGGPPWAAASAGGENFSLAEADKNQTGVLANQDMSKIVDWNLGEYQSNDQCFFCGEGAHASDAPYVWDATTGERIDRWPTNVGVVADGEEFKGKTAVSADLSHFAFSSNLAFVHGGLSGDVYDNNTETGEIKIASLSPLGANLTDLTPLKVSENGSHVVMTTGVGLCGGSKQTALSCGPGEIYVRADGSRTYEVSPGHAVNFLGISGDGKKLFLDSEEQLTAEDEDTSNDLYEWSEARALAEPAKALKLISIGDHGEAGNTDACRASWTTKCNAEPILFTTPTNGGYPNLQGGIGGNGVSDTALASETGEIYFYSPEQLEGNRGIQGNENLYVYHEGRPQLVAALTPGQVCTPDQGTQFCSEGPVARMDISPDGKHMAFISSVQVTDYNSQGFTEMYTYDPESRTIACASCVPDGEPPAFDTFGSQNGLFMTDDGRAFYYTEQSLVPQDTNRGEDVYEYSEGKPQLITAGTGAGYATTFGIVGVVTSPGLIGVSANGTDVYLGTYEHLVEQDENGQELKIYDARTNGGFPYRKPPPTCAAADECHGAGSPAPASQTEGTSASLGERGNLAAPAKQAKKKHKRHKKKNHKHAKKKKKAPARKQAHGKARPTKGADRG
jgi:hypothetical protein